MSSSIKPFSIKLGQVHARIFEGCFKIMSHELRFNICEVDDSFQWNKDIPNLPARISKNMTEALRYGVLFWFSHLEQSDIDVKESAEKVLTFLDSLKTLFWIEALGLMDVVDRGVVILQDCAYLFTVRLSFRNVEL